MSEATEDLETSSGFSGYDEIFDAVSGEDAPATDAEGAEKELTELGETDESTTGKDDTQEAEGEPEVQATPATDTASDKKDTAATPSYKAVGADGKEFEIAPDVKIIKEIDGKMQEIPLAAVVKDYAFNVNYTKKYQELSNERKATEAEKAQATEERTRYEADQARLKETLNLVGSALRETGDSIRGGKVDDFLTQYSSITQIPKAQLVTALRGHFLPDIKKYLEADEYEQQRLDAEERTRYLEQQQAQLQTREQQLTAQQQGQQNLARMIDYARERAEVAGVDTESWQAAERELLAKNGITGKIDYSQYPPEQLKNYVDNVTSFAQARIIHRKAEEVIGVVAPDLQEARPEEWASVKEIILPFVDRLSTEELQQAVSEVLGVDQKESLEQAAPKKAAAEQAQSIDDDDEDIDPESVYRMT